MAQYNGHKNWNHWNVALWIGSDERLYWQAKEFIRKAGTKDRAATLMYDWLDEQGIRKTPDGAPYSRTAIRAAIAGYQ